MHVLGKGLRTFVQYVGWDRWSLNKTAIVLPSTSGKIVDSVCAVQTYRHEIGIFFTSQYVKLFH